MSKCKKAMQQNPIYTAGGVMLAILAGIMQIDDAYRAFEAIYTAHQAAIANSERLSSWEWRCLCSISANLVTQRKMQKLQSD